MEVSDRMIHYVGSIEPETISRVQQTICDYMFKSPSDEITLNLASAGGRVYVAMGFYDFVRVYKVPLKIIGFGEISSAAITMWLAAASERRFVGMNSHFLLHEQSRSFDRNAHLFSSEVAHLSDQMQKSQKKAFNLIAEECGKPLSDIERIAKESPYLNVLEAIKLGLVKLHQIV